MSQVQLEEGTACPSPLWNATNLCDVAARTILRRDVHVVWAMVY